MQTRWLWPAMAGVMLLSALTAHAQEASSMQQRLGDLIVTSGEGLVQAPPDRAFVSISAESRAKLPKEAQQANAQAMSAVQAKLKAAGITGDAIKTTAVDLQPEFDYQNGKQTLRGYVARNTIEVRVEPVERVGEIVDAAVGSGATSVSGVRFDLKDRAAAEKKALQEAVTDARGRGEALAQAAGRSVDRIVRIDDQGVRNVPPPRPFMMAKMADAAGAPPTPVEAGQLEIRAQVTLTLQLK